MGTTPFVRQALHSADSLRSLAFMKQETSLYQALSDSLAQAGDSAGYWQAQLRMAVAMLGDAFNHEEARSVAERALASRGGDLERAGWARHVLASAHLRQGEFAPAMREAARALSAARENGDRELEAAVYGVLGALHWRSGRCRESLSFRERALTLRRELLDPVRNTTAQDLGQALEDVGETYLCLGGIADATRAYREALDGFRRVGDPWGEARSFFQLAKLRPASGDLEQAAQLMSKAREFLHQNGKRIDVMLYNYVAELYMRAGNGQAAREELVFWTSGLRGEELVYEETVMLENVGRLELATGRPGQARKVLARALFLADSRGFSRQQVTIRALIARAEAALGDPAKAVALADSAVRLADAAEDPEVALDALEAKGLALEAAGSDSAIQTHLRALDLLEARRSRLSLEDVRLGLAESRLGVYESAIRSLLEHGRAGEGFEVAERARARVLLELIAQGSTADAAKAGGDTRPRPADLAADPEQARLTQPAPPPEPARLAEVQADLAGPGRAVLAFFWGDRDVYGWWVEDQTVRARRLGSSDSLAALVGFLRGSIEDPTAGPDWRPAARRAYRELVAPLSPSAVPDVYVVVDGPLAYVPMEVLIPSLEELPWGATRRLIYGPSASVLVSLARASHPERWERSVLAVGNPHGAGPAGRPRTSGVAGVAEKTPAQPPQGGLAGGAPEEALAPLPYAEEEARTIQRIFRRGRSDLLVGPRATLERWLELDPRRYRYLHFATHARVSNVRPSSTHLVLAGDRLELADIRRLSLNAELVTLSACETALGKRVRGEGVIGLPHAFLAAGARGVVVTLWRVDDRATAEFMGDFYRELRAGRPPAEALLRVRRSRLSEEGVVSHPSRWAPFLLMGEGIHRGSTTRTGVALSVVFPLPSAPLSFFPQQ